MSKVGIPFESIKAELLGDEEAKKEYDALEPRYAIVSQIIEARKARNMTQADLAKKVGTQKSNISRLESGRYNPSLDLLIKVAKGLGMELKVELITENQ